MKLHLLDIKGTWRSIANAARTTINKDYSTSVVPFGWRRRMLLSEHSPIRKLLINWKWLELPYWVSTHFVRHKYGIEHWVSTQRDDRAPAGEFASRAQAPQGQHVMHECEANAQAIINISRKRLCQQASPETREAWQKLIDTLELVEPELASVCVPDCIYRGWCYEYNSCGYHLTEHYQKALAKYREGINHAGA